MRKTKIICTMGPATDSMEVLEELVAEGMDVARFNFSHGTHEEQAGRMERLRAAREKYNKPVAMLLDTKGPEIRVRDFKNGKISVTAGQTFTLTGRRLIGDETIASITYPTLSRDIAPGTRILIDDGLIEMIVDSVDGEDIHCIVQNDGVISNHKGVNVPGVHANMPYMSEQDREDILFGIKQGVDYVAASFVRSGADVLQIRSLLYENGGSDIKIIAKIENQQGIDNIDEIIEAADGIMVARGDLGVEVPSYQVPMLQKEIIGRCRKAGKNVIVATQMLDSMIRNPRPTRAEVNDVAQAVYDGASAVMLSGETASGKYPVEALTTMADIAQHVESSIDYWKDFCGQKIIHSRNVGLAISRACCTTAMELDAKAIVTVTNRGITAKAVARYRPGCPILALTVDERTRRLLSLVWGVETALAPVVDSTDKLLNLARSRTWELGYVQEDDLAVVTAGIPVGISGSTNLIKVLRF